MKTQRIEIYIIKTWLRHVQCNQWNSFKPTTLSEWIESFIAAMFELVFFFFLVQIKWFDSTEMGMKEHTTIFIFIFSKHFLCFFIRCDNRSNWRKQIVRTFYRSSIHCAHIDSEPNRMYHIVFFLSKANDFIISKRNNELSQQFLDQNGTLFFLFTLSIWFEATKHNEAKRNDKSFKSFYVMKICLLNFVAVNSTDNLN